MCNICLYNVRSLKTLIPVPSIQLLQFYIGKSLHLLFRLKNSPIIHALHQTNAYKFLYMQLKLTIWWNIRINQLNYSVWPASWNNSNKIMDSHKEYGKDYFLFSFQFQILCLNSPFSVFRNICHFLKEFFCSHSATVFHISSVICQSQQTNCYGYSSSLATDLKSRCLNSCTLHALA